MIRVEELTGVYGVDALRFWAARAVTLGQDADVTAEGFHERYERELATTWNLLAHDRLDRALGRLPRGGGSADGAELAAGDGARERGRRALRPLRDHDRARPDLGSRPRLNRFVEQTKPGSSRAIRAAEELRACYDLADGLRVVAVALAAYVPDTSARSCAASGSRSTSPGRTSLLVAPSRRAGSSQSRSSRASTRPPPPRDRYARAPRRARGAVGGRRARPRRRRDPRRHDRDGIDSCRQALDLTGTRASTPRSGSTRTRRARRRRARERAAGASPTRRPGPSARPGSTTTTAATEEQRQLFAAQLALAAELQLPIVLSMRAANADTEAPASPRRHGRHALLLRAGAWPPGSSGLVLSFAGNVTYPKAEPLRAAAAAVPADRLLAETDSPYLAPQAVRGRTNEPAHVVHTLAALAAVRGDGAEEPAVGIDANATAAFRLP